jgi:hypothetical protein
LELSIPPSPTRLGGVRRAARACLRGISEEIADDVVVALNEAATNAVLYGSQGGSSSRSSSPSPATGLRRRSWIMARRHHPGVPPTPTAASCAPAAGAFGCCASWWMRYGWSGSSSAPG